VNKARAVQAAHENERTPTGLVVPKGEQGLQGDNGRGEGPAKKDVGVACVVTECGRGDP